MAAPEGKYVLDPNPPPQANLIDIKKKKRLYEMVKTDDFFYLAPIETDFSPRISILAPRRHCSRYCWIQGCWYFIYLLHNSLLAELLLTFYVHFYFKWALRIKINRNKPVFVPLVLDNP